MGRWGQSLWCRAPGSGTGLGRVKVSPLWLSAAGAVHGRLNTSTPALGPTGAPSYGGLPTMRDPAVFGREVASCPEGGICSPLAQPWVQVLLSKQPVSPGSLNK